MTANNTQNHQNLPISTKILKDKILQKFESHLDKRRLSLEVDRLLGFNIKKIEERLRTEALKLSPDSTINEWGPLLHNGSQSWIGLDFQVLQTTYHDLRSIFEIISPAGGKHVVDLGAGYGRVGTFLHLFYPKTRFTGYEIVSERVQEGNRVLSSLNALNKTLITCDISQLKTFPKADIYFIYDFGSESHIESLLTLLDSIQNATLIVKGIMGHNIIRRKDLFSVGVRLKDVEDVTIYQLKGHH